MTNTAHRSVSSSTAALPAARPLAVAVGNDNDRGGDSKRAASGGWTARLIMASAVVVGLAIAAKSTGRFDPMALLRGAAVVPVVDASAANDKSAVDAVTAAGAARITTFRPSDAHWLTLSVATVEHFRFRELVATDGKIAIDEDHTTPVFSPYAGRIVRLMAKPGDKIELGSPLFTIDALDMVQAQNDYLAANSGLNKARSAFELAEKIFLRNQALFDAKAAPLKDLQAAADGLTAAKSDHKTAQTALDASRNRLLILGKTKTDVDALVTQGRITSETTVNAPLSGTIVQRKVGPGQFLATGASDPVFVIGDLSTVWLLANVRETDTLKMRVGQTIEFTTLAIPNRKFTARISYVAPSVDPATRRVQVRAEIANPDRVLKPEMFANVDIVTNGDEEAASVPRSALIYEGSNVRVWIARADKTIELRKIEVGLTNNDDHVQVTKGLVAGDKVISRGSLFIDRIAKTND